MSPLLLALAPANAAPPPCLPLPDPAPVTVRVERQGFSQDGSWRHEQTTLQVPLPEIDLDGDGVLDRLVPRLVPGACPWEASYRVILVRGTCGQDLGDVVGLPQPGERGPAGLVALETRVTRTELGPDSIPIEHTTTRRYTAADGARGAAYTLESEQTRSARCHHCPISSCSQP